MLRAMAWWVYTVYRELAILGLCEILVGGVLGMNDFADERYFLYVLPWSLLWGLPSAQGLFQRPGQLQP